MIHTSVSIGIGYWYCQRPILLEIGYWVLCLAWYCSNPNSWSSAAKFASLMITSSVKLGSYWRDEEQTFFFVFSTWQHICYSVLYAIAHLSICPSVHTSVCPSVTRMDQSKTLKLGTCNFHHKLAPWNGVLNICWIFAVYITVNESCIYVER